MFRSGRAAPLLALLAAVLSALCAAAAPAPKPASTCTWKGLFLPTTIVPDSYDVRLQVDMKAFKVTGYTAISLNVTASTSCIVLHADSLTITSVALVFKGKTKYAGKVGKQVEESQLVTLTFNHKLKISSGEYSLQLRFKYPLADGVDGFYRSVYTDSKNKANYLASTQLESIAARKAFPCFDEMKFKAKFKITLETPPGLVAISNMPKASVKKLKGGAVRHTFAETPYMSTYLVAFLVGKIEGVTIKCKLLRGNTRVSAWGTPDRKQLLGTAANIACASLRKTENMTGIPYPLPKLDLAAIPDFAAGAMENWGLIFYREASVLLDPKTSAVDSAYRVAFTVAHEIAHMWFGDLVTGSDWNELWLNEGFATYWEHIGTNAYDSKFRSFDFFYEAVIAPALADDSAPSSHALTTSKYTTLGEIDQLFDSIMYEKGGSVLRMLRAFMNRNRLAIMDNPGTSRDDFTVDPFLKGVVRYLKARQYKSSTYKDLWGNMQAATGLPISKWMNTWTLRSGYPLVTLVVKKGGGLVVQQQPFFSSDPDKPGPGQPPITCNSKAPLGAWWVPLAWRNQAGASGWSPFSTCAAKLPGKLAKGGYVLLNQGRFGFFRVNYPRSMWAALAKAATLKPSAKGYIGIVDYAGLLDDSFRLSEAGQLPITVFLELTAALGSRLEANAYTPWSLATQQLQRIKFLLSTAPRGSKAACVDKLTKWMQKKVTGPFLARTTIPGKKLLFSFNTTANEAVAVRRLRPLVLATAAAFGDKGQAASAVKYLKQIKSKGIASVPADLRETVYSMAVQGGSEEAFNIVLALYRKEKDAAEKEKLGLALTYASTAPLISKALNLATTSDVKLADMGLFISSLGEKGGLQFKLTWEFLFANTPKLLGRYPGGGAGTEASYSFGRPIKDSLGDLFSDSSLLPKLQVWAKNYANVLDPEFVQGVKDSIAKNSQWLKNEGASVCAWLKTQKY